MTKAQAHMRSPLTILLMLAAPPLIFAVLLAMQLAPMAPGFAVTYIEIGLALIPGLVGIWRLSQPIGYRLLALLVYIPTMSFALSVWGLIFMCGAVRACL